MRYFPENNRTSGPPWGGHVGIGTTSPGGALQVNGTTILGGALSTSGGDFSFMDAGVADSTAVRLMSNGGNLFLQNGSGGNTYFRNKTAATVMTVQNGSNVGIGTTSPAYMLHVNGSVAGVGAYNALSDIRYKKDVKSLAHGLAKVLAIRGVTYKWIDEDKYGSQTQIGVIAQEIEKIVPDVVSTGTDGVKRVKYTDLIPLVIEAMQEQNAKLEQLKADSAHLKADNAQLKARADMAEADSAQLKADNAQLKSDSAQLKSFICGQFPTAALCH